MIAKRLNISILVIFLLNAFYIQDTNAQTDLELYRKHIENKDESPTLIERYLSKYAESDSGYTTVQESRYQTLLDLIKNKKQASIRNVFFIAKDTADITYIFKLLKQFPNITELSFSYSDDYQPQYEFPNDFLALKNLKFLSISGAKNISSRDLFSKLKTISTLKGVDLSNYGNAISQDATLPAHLTFVKLSTPQLQKLDTKNAVWRYARILQGNEDDVKDEHLLQKLADIKSLETLDCQFLYIKDGSAFKDFKNLRKLTIYPLLSPEVNLIKSLSVLSDLKELALYSISDTSQSFSELNKFKNLESLDLRWLTRFQTHPEELKSIATLKDLRSLSIQSCDMMVCPDFFQSLKALENFTFKWNVMNWSEESIFTLPESLYHLPELRKLIVWKTLSETPSLKDLLKLQILDFNNNNLKKVPEGLTELKNLKSLILSNNFLRNIDYKWEELQSLETLDLSRSNLRTYPAGIQRLYNLIYLNVEQNKFSKIPSLQHQPYKLKVLLLNGNLLDSLPENIANYKYLEVLSANYCGLYTLPVDFGLLKNLSVLNLERNHLKVLPMGIGDNLNLKSINLKGNSNISEQTLNDLIFKKPKNNFLWANLENTGIKALPANAPWDNLKLVLDLKNNQLTTLPIEMSKMEWFNITLHNNPFFIDTGFIERGIRSPADARIFFSELGYKKDYLKVTDREMATSLSKASNMLTFYKNFNNAVRYAGKAKKLDKVAFEKNIDKQSLGVALYETKNYRQAIDMLEEDKRLNNRFLWSARKADASETALANSYDMIGNKRKAVETHAFFATRKKGSLESSISAAIGYLELNDLALSKKYFEDALALSKAAFMEYENLKGIYIYNYAELLLMAERPETVLALFAEVDPKVSAYNPSYRDYLRAVALLMINPKDYSLIKDDYLKKVAKNGKIRDWNYDAFNNWIKASKRPLKEKQQIQELELLNR